MKQGHSDEVLDVSFDSCGSKFVSASADGTARIYNTLTGEWWSWLLTTSHLPSPQTAFRLQALAFTPVLVMRVKSARSHSTLKGRAF